MKLLNAATLRGLQLGSVAIATSVLVACGGGGGPPHGTVSGTSAVGAPLANAVIQLSCKDGTDKTAANANGIYTTTFPFDGPCLITATSGSLTINSFASGPGTFNVTPLTELLLSYLAGQLGTTLNGLLEGIATNATYQNALTNSTVIANAENGVAQLLKSTYSVTLSTTSFLTSSFTPGQPGEDADLDALEAAGAITSDGQPTASLASAAVAAGAAAGSPESGGASGSGTPTGGASVSGAPTGGTGGTGGT